MGGRKRETQRKMVKSRSNFR